MPSVFLYALMHHTPTVYAIHADLSAVIQLLQTEHVTVAGMCASTGTYRADASGVA